MLVGQSVFTAALDSLATPVFLPPEGLRMPRQNERRHRTGIGDAAAPVPRPISSRGLPLLKIHIRVMLSDPSVSDGVPTGGSFGWFPFLRDL
jgi:hypothetical protein